MSYCDSRRKDKFLIQQNQTQKVNKSLEITRAVCVFI